MKPFVDFYRSNQISPVAQDISDLRRHLDRRDALYRHLGLVPGWLRGRTVIEFGPGSGYNALHTASPAPSRYVMVDGNPTGLNAARGLLANRFPATQFAFVETMIEDFETDERFDLVICEGTIPFQMDPPAFLRRVARFAVPGGVVVTTCVDGISMLAETLRRLAGALLFHPEWSTAEKLKVLLPVFSPHLATLAGMSRSHEDWILDQIVQPLVGRLLSIDDAIVALDAEFDTLGTSPRFMADWRWHKDIHGDAKRYNLVAREAYVRNLHNLTDYRLAGDPRPAEGNRRLLALGDALFYQVQHFIATRDAGVLAAVLESVTEIATLCLEFAPVISAALADYRRALVQWQATGSLPPFGGFAACFGRGQQYLSFIRR
jgi:ubiquinone/menaquinone biosynthesis C-methylase UbiE